MSRRAFTVIELLVVVAIIAIISGLLLPAVQSARQTARKIECQNKVRQIALGLHSHTDAFGKLPPGTDLQPESRYLSWCVRILPFLEQKAVYEEAQASLRRSSNVFSAADHRLLLMANPAFSCPEDPRTFETVLSMDSGKLVGLLSYLGSNGTNHDEKNGVLFGGSAVAWKQITDGMSNTIMLCERPPSVGNDYGWWYAGVGNGDGTLDHTLGAEENTFSRFTNSICPPNSYRRGVVSDECSTSHFWSLHIGGANMGFCDGSVRFLSYSGKEVVSKLATRNGGEVSTTGQ